MYKNISYGDKKIEELIRKKHVIPYSLTIRDRYEKGKYYYSEFYRKTFRVLFVKYYNSGELEGAEVKDDNGLYSYICTDIDPGYDYRLEKDFGEIYKIEDIVNSGKVFTGAEIKYWFFIKGITCFNKKYKGFWQYVDTYSILQISDRLNYVITADLTFTGKYYNCKITRIEKVPNGD